MYMFITVFAPEAVDFKLSYKKTSLRNNEFDTRYSLYFTKKCYLHILIVVLDHNYGESIPLYLVFTKTVDKNGARDACLKQKTNILLFNGEIFVE
jgi:hypothetical protein